MRHKNTQGQIVAKYARLGALLLLLLYLSLGLSGHVPYPISQSVSETGEYKVSAELIRFAAIGDYGRAGTGELEVANLVKSWSPDFVITVGDNNYETGSASTIDQNIGRYYHSFIFPYGGSYGEGADRNRFFPTLGNHDWSTAGARPYLSYFALPGNERYYDFVWGPVHFFALDSDPNEPDGNTRTSKQANWLREGLAASTAPWKLVYFHHAPYSSGRHGSSAWMQWPFQEWGATAVMSGHDHSYERLLVDGIPYFVNGLGGVSKYSFGKPLSESQVRYDDDFGAILIQSDSSSIGFKFFNRTGALVDEYTIMVRDSTLATAAPAVRSIAP